MTKQEKIREWLAQRRYYGASLPRVGIKWEELTPFAKECWFHLADDDMEWLDSQGVVIKGALLTFEGKPVGFEVEPLVER